MADQLYDKPTHFLLELIQNADDNTYVIDSEPTLTFNTDFPSTSPVMIIDCNEVGFKKKDVKAICSLGQSTKTIQDRTKGFIGEKGIGFKSVFKVADVVHISSGPFQFKFDRQENLGMIAPIVEPFPQAHYKDGQTQIFLQLNDSATLTEINAEIDSIRPELLIFLRKLSKIIIITATRYVYFHTTVNEADTELNGETIKLFEAQWDGFECSTENYIIVRHKARHLPHDERRLEVDKSDVILAFPVLENAQPDIKNRSTYAYLPFGNYGFSVRRHSNQVGLQAKCSPVPYPSRLPTNCQSWRC
jgi:hypothetical protein